MRNELGQRRVAEVVYLRDKLGLTFKEIADRLGIALTTAHDYYADPTGEKADERRSKLHGVCRDCGAETRGGSKTAPERCAPCNSKWQRTLEGRRLRRSNTTLKWSDEDIFAAIRSVAVDGIATCTAYKEAYARAPRGSMPSMPLINVRFGLWSNAVAAAGLTTRHAGGAYSTRLTTEGAMLAVEECAHELGSAPTVAQYEEWARRTGAPSATLIRIRCGRPWLDIVSPFEQKAAA